MDNTINKQFTFDDNREISEQMAPWFIISIMIQTGDDCLVIVTGVTVVIALRHTAAVHPLPVPANRILDLYLMRKQHLVLLQIHSQLTCQK